VELSQDDAEAIAKSLHLLPNSLLNENRLTKELDLLCLNLPISILKYHSSIELIVVCDRCFLRHLATVAISCVCSLVGT
jgi:hypothetical protein